jgi:lysozyme
VSRFDAGVVERALRYIGKPPPAPQSADAIGLAADLCRQFESFESHPYLCPAGVPSIGYGATRYLDGRRVQLTDQPISQAAAERLLLVQLEREYLPDVRRLCPGVVEPNRLAALLDFTYNIGEGRLATSTLRRRVNAEQWGDVPAELRKWVNGGGRRLRGLVLRREAEAALI